MSATAGDGGNAATGALPRCSVAAGSRADPLRGTAPPARRWLLLEHPGPWPVDAVAGSGLEPAVLSRLTTAAARTATRILLVRRPGRRPATTRRRWMLAGPGLPSLTGHWDADAELDAAVEALTAAARPSAADMRPGAGDAGGEPLLLVCAHGVHDTCCAIRGRPVAAALEERWPGQVWECSHIGGDRFAPNVVVLPDGFYYGGLDPAGAVATVAEHLAGRVGTPFLRGMARFPPAQQAAVIAAHERHGPLGPDDVTVAAARHEGPYGAPGSRTLVELRVAGLGHPVHAEVVPVRRPPAQLTCRAVRETTATEYRVELSD